MEPEENEASVEVTDVADIATTVAESASEPNEAAMQALREQHLSAAPAVRTVATDSANSTDSPTDSKGNAFDPAVHHANPDGSPKLYNGKLRRKRASKVESVSTVGGQAANSPVAPLGVPNRELTPSEKEAARLLGKQAANALIQIAMLAGGPEFTPIKGDSFETAGPEMAGGIDERKMLQDALGAYCEQKRLTTMTPEAGLALAIVPYVGMRFFMPQTKTRLQRLKDWTLSKLLGWRSRSNATRTNSRNDNERKEHSSVEARAGRPSDRPQVDRT